MEEYTKAKELYEHSKTMAEETFKLEIEEENDKSPKVTLKKAFNYRVPEPMVSSAFLDCSCSVVAFLVCRCSPTMDNECILGCRRFGISCLTCRTSIK